MRFLAFVKKYYKYLFIYALGGISAYILYLLTKQLTLQGSIYSLIKAILTYPVFTKDNNPITLAKICVGITLIVMGYHLSKSLSSKISDKIYSRFKLDKGAISSLENLTFYGFLSFFTLFALNTANVPLTMFTVLGGALAIGVGFGSQNIINNFISGIIVLIERPLKVGDLVEVEGTRGVVEHIGARRTVIRSTNGTTSIYPNSFLLDKKLINYMYESTVNRCDIKVVVPINSDLHQIKEKVLEELNKNKFILLNPGPSVIFSEYLESVPNVVLIVSVWIDLKGPVSKTEIESDIRFLIHKLCLNK